MMSLREALAEAKRLGCKVYRPRKTGEVVVSHPDHGRIRMNARRDDATKRFISFIRKVRGDG